MKSGMKYVSLTWFGIAVLSGCDIWAQSRIEVRFAERIRWDAPSGMPAEKAIDLIRSLSWEHDLVEQEAGEDRRLVPDWVLRDGGEWSRCLEFRRIDNRVGPRVTVATYDQSIAVVISIWAHAFWQLESYDDLKGALIERFKREFGDEHVVVIVPYFPSRDS